MKKHLDGVLFLVKDIAIIAISVVVAVELVRFGVINKILESIAGFEFIGSFVAGMFFTSVFTTIPSIATLGELAIMRPIFQVAFFGALGAVVGDLVIFRFIRDRFSLHLLELLKHESLVKRFKILIRLKYFRWMTFLVGGLIIASPFPDELAISLLGFAKMKTRTFLLVSFIFNFLGILVISIIARAL